MKTKKMFVCTIDEEDGELVTLKLAPVDLQALLALADEMEQETGSVCGVCMGKSARRIREALGVES